MSNFNMISNDCILVTIEPVPLQVPGNKTRLTHNLNSSINPQSVVYSHSLVSSLSLM